MHASEQQKWHKMAKTVLTGKKRQISYLPNGWSYDLHQHLIRSGNIIFLFMFHIIYTPLTNRTKQLLRHFQLFFFTKSVSNSRLKLKIELLIKKCVVEGTPCTIPYTTVVYNKCWKKYIVKDRDNPLYKERLLQAVKMFNNLNL